MALDATGEDESLEKLEGKLYLLTGDPGLMLEKTVVDCEPLFIFSIWEASTPIAGPLPASTRVDVDEDFFFSLVLVGEDLWES